MKHKFGETDRGRLKAEGQDPLSAFLAPRTNDLRELDHPVLLNGIELQSEGPVHLHEIMNESARMSRKVSLDKSQDRLESLRLKRR